MPDDAWPLIRPETPKPNLEATALQLKLMRRLQTSLEATTLVERFYATVGEALALSGLHYQGPEGGEPELQLGQPGRHKCDYALHGEERPLGSLVFTRNRRFSEQELAQLEQWLALLVAPLNNARRYQEALRLAMVDSLTGLANRAALDSALHRELRLAERHQSHLSLLLLDIDHFKQINDRWGHSRGDEILRSAASAIEDACRDSDLVYRYGGEEFVVILRNTDSRGAAIIAERLREHLALWLATHESIEATVSIGIGSREPHSETAHADDSLYSLFDRADQALYRAKTQGRNRVVTQLQSVSA